MASQGTPPQRPASEVLRLALMASMASQGTTCQQDRELPASGLSDGLTGDTTAAASLRGAAVFFTQKAFFFLQFKNLLYLCSAKIYKEMNIIHLKFTLLEYAATVTPAPRLVGVSNTLIAFPIQLCYNQFTMC